MKGVLITVGLILIATSTLTSAEQVRYGGADQFLYSETKDRVTVSGGVWVRLVPSDGLRSWAPGAVVECKRTPKTCVLTQFYDGGATSVVTTFAIASWSPDRIEADRARQVIDTSVVTAEYSAKLAGQCLIVDLQKRRLFLADVPAKQTCTQIADSLSSGDAFVGVDQLCAASDTTTDGCPNPPIKRDKHGDFAPTPTYYESKGTRYCEDWVLNQSTEWEVQTHKCGERR